MTIARHTSTEPAPSDRGHGFGRAHAAAVANTVAFYERVFREDRFLAGAALDARGEEAEARIRAHRPDLALEIEGIAAGAGQSPRSLFAINARTELLAGGALAGATAGECSTVAVIDDAGETVLLAQNWDFHPALRASQIVWTIHHHDGRVTRTLTEAGIVGKVGVNADGVGVAINFLATDQDGGLGGVPVHALCRTVLDEAPTVEVAAGLVRDTAVSASVCITVAGPSAAGGVTALALERWPGGLELVATEAGRRWLAHTNHFLRAIPARDVLAASRNAASTKDRLTQLTRALESNPAAGTDQVTALLSSRGEPGLEPVFRIEDTAEPWLERCATLATLAVESPSARMWVRDATAPDGPLEAVV